MIVAFIRAESKKFEDAANEANDAGTRLRLEGSAYVQQTLAAYIERGDHESPIARGEF